MDKPRYDFINEDKRIIERGLRHNHQAKQDYQKILKSLPDDREHGEESAVYSATDDREVVHSA